MVTSKRETEKGLKPACLEELGDKVGVKCLLLTSAANPGNRTVRVWPGLPCPPLPLISLIVLSSGPPWSPAQPQGRTDTSQGLSSF